MVVVQRMVVEVVVARLLAVEVAVARTVVVVVVAAGSWRPSSQALDSLQFRSNQKWWWSTGSWCLGNPSS